MRVLRTLAGVVLAGGFLPGTAPPAWAQEPPPPALDVRQALDQLDDLAQRLQNEPVHNAPGRDDPVDTRLAQLADEKYGLSVRIAAFSTPAPAEPITDYAPELRKRFPDEIVLVAHDRWLDVAAADQAKADSARDYAYGRYENASFSQGSPMGDRIGTVLERLQFLIEDTAYGRPQPQPQPRAQPFDVRRTTIPPPPTPDAPQSWQIALSVVGILLGTIALFVGLRLVGRLVALRAARDAGTRTRSAATSARLNRLADTVLHARTPRDAAQARRQADLAEQYVRVLGEFEAAGTRAELAAVDERITELEAAQ